MISVKARWERWCRWNCDLRVINARKSRHDTQITWPYAYYVTLGSHCKMANLSSEDETDTLPERPTRIRASQAGFSKSTRTSFHRYSMGFAKSHSLKCSLHKWAWFKRAVLQHSKKVSSFELYKFNPLSPHCGLIAWELVHCYTWGHLWIVTVRGNTIGQHS